MHKLAEPQAPPTRRRPATRCWSSRRLATLTASVDVRSGGRYDPNMRSPDLDEAKKVHSDPSESAYLQPPFSTVSQLLAEIDGDGAQALSTKALHEDVEWLASVVASGPAVIAPRAARGQ